MAKSGGGGRGGRGGGRGGGGGGTGVDGGVTQTPEGDIQPNGRLGPVSNQEEFNQRMSQLAGDINREFEMDGLVPIYMLRRASGLERTEFDRYMRGMQNDGRIEMVEGGAIPLNARIGRIPPLTNQADMTLRDPRAQQRVNDGWTTPLGNLRMWARI